MVFLSPTFLSMRLVDTLLMVLSLSSTPDVDLAPRALWTVHRFPPHCTCGPFPQATLLSPPLCPLALFAMLQERAAQAGVGEGSQGAGSSKRHLGPDPVLDLGTPDAPPIQWRSSQHTLCGVPSMPSSCESTRTMLNSCLEPPCEDLDRSISTPCR